MAVDFDAIETNMATSIAGGMAAAANQAIEDALEAAPALAGSIAADRTAADFALLAEPIAAAVREALETYDAG